MKAACLQLRRVPHPGTLERCLPTSACPCKSNGRCVSYTWRDSLCLPWLVPRSPLSCTQLRAREAGANSRQGERAGTLRRRAAPPRGRPRA